MFENGGGSGMEVSWTPTPGADLARLSSDVLSNRFGCPCHSGLYFEAYTPGDNFQWGSLASLEANGVSADMWMPGWTPIVQHE